MLPPHRHGSPLNSPLLLPQFPFPEVWTGKIAYLDRDGVLNKWSENYVNTPQEVEVLPNSGKSVAALRRSGFRVCVVTNQSPIGRGLWGHKRLEQINQELQDQLLEEDSEAHLDLILYSPYTPSEGSWARKPNPGMLEAARQIIESAEKGIHEIHILYGDDWVDRPDESESVLVGDQPTDIEAASSFGVKGIQCSQTIGISEVMSQIIQTRG